MNGMRDRFTKKKKDNYRKEKKRKEKKTRRATQFCFAYTKLGTCTGNDSSSRKCPLFSIKKKKKKKKKKERKNYYNNFQY